MSELGQYFTIFYAWFVLYLVFIFWLGKTKNHAGYIFILFVFIGLALRCYFFLESPLLSDDIFRYYLDGKTLANGIHPFAYAPNAPELSFLQDSLTLSVNHPGMPTVYPFFTQALFWLGYEIGGGLTGIKIILSLFELGSFGLLLLILKKMGRSRMLSLIYFLHPLIVLELYGSGHTESFSIFFLLLSFYCFITLKPTLSFIQIGIAGLIKYIGILPGGFFLGKLSWKKILPVSMGFLSLFLIFWHSRLFESLLFYQKNFEFNGFLYQIGKLFTGGPQIRLFLGIIFISGMLYLLWNYRKSKLTDRNAYLTFLQYSLALYLFTTPTLHPWYLTLLLPFLAIRLNLSLLFLSGTVFLSYNVLFNYKNQGIWQESNWVLWIEYLPVIVLLFFELVFKDQFKNFKTRFNHPL